MADLIVRHSVTGKVDEPIDAVASYDEYKHDSFTYVVPWIPVNARSDYRAGTPIEASWGVQHFGGSFHGYIDGIGTPYAQTAGSGIAPSKYMEIRCVGASYPLKSAPHKTWTTQTASDIAVDIARRFGLSIAVDEHPYRWSSVTTEDKSWWEFLVALAKRIGYTVFMLDTTLFFVDRRRAGGRVVPLIYRLSDKTRTEDYYAVRRFDPEISGGNGSVGVMPGRFYITVNSVFSGQAYTLTSDDRTFYGNDRIFDLQFLREVRGETATTMEEGQMFLRGAEAANLFTTRSKMTIAGNARIHPGDVVRLQSEDENKIYAGDWYVLGAAHSVSDRRGNYISVIELGTDAAGTSLTQPTSRNIFKDKKLLFPPAALRGRAWTSKWSTVKSRRMVVL